ncbi:tail fiber domain-containing protein [Mucilaginibacter pallidiroseus]|uniref:Tail fiber domain-containing protein n=1 Tax=Mucilaginibacter pallidiroseus TaxID=2599295 RepID=A0A563UD59_9SPHI|nr:tail fiber domain-containing protein [Mucilaginibacter pallidiroseus]TWR29295.1 tail fiber domain-containing protein [Mucilaginibacter pallidiroseus]
MTTKGQILLSFFAIGSLIAISNTASAQQISDSNLKKNTAPVTNAVSYLSRLQPITFEYNKDANKQLNLPSGLQYGFNADELKQVVPAAVSMQNNWYRAGKNNQRSVSTANVELEKLVPLLVAAVKDQQVEIENLKSEIARLKTGSGTK